MQLTGMKEQQCLDAFNQDKFGDHVEQKTDYVTLMNQEKGHYSK